MTKREIASLLFKIIGVYLLASSIGWFNAFFILATNIKYYDLSTVIAPICQLIPILAYLIILFLIISQSDVLAAKLIKQDKAFDLSLSVNKNEILVIAFCCIGLSLLIKVVPNIISIFTTRYCIY